MKNIVLSIVVISALVVAGIGGTFAGFVDTEVSRDNYLKIGILDLLISGVPTNVLVQHNDSLPDADPPNTIGVIVGVDNFDPQKPSVDLFIDAYSRSTVDGFLYMHYKDVQSVEAGSKDGKVYERSSNSYVTGTDPTGALLASSEPEWIAEHGLGQVGQTQILANDPALTWQANMALRQGLGEDYASGVADHLSVSTYKYLDANGILTDPDINPTDGKVSGTEKTELVARGGSEVLVTELTGLLKDINSVNTKLGTMKPQTRTMIHVQLDVPQILGPSYDYDGDGGAIDADDNILRWWPTNAIQGDKATWDMLFTLTSDP